MRFRILIVDDDESASLSTKRVLEHAGYGVVCAHDGVHGLEVLRQMQELDPVHLILSDVRMPRMGGFEFLKALKLMGQGQAKLSLPVVFMTGFGSVEDAVWAMKSGAVDFLTKPIKRTLLLETVDQVLRRVYPQSGTPVGQVGQGLQESFLGQSHQVQELLSQVGQVAATAASVLIFGESGTGKELLAREVHRLSARSSSRFVALNCAALPDNLIEAELFGHEKGAFTGAAGARIGLFEAAHRGTIFLDEIGEMPLGVQAKLLRVLQDGEIRRVGATQTQRVDVRLIAATHRDLPALVADGKFREDLFYRLQVVTLISPPLRERLEDLRILVAHFLKHFNEHHQKQIQGVSEACFKQLQAYPWPGNVRELSNILERAVVLSNGPLVEPEDLPPHLLSESLRQEVKRSVEVPLGISLEEVEQLLIKKTLEMTSGNRERAARILGVNARTIYRKLDQNK